MSEKIYFLMFFSSLTLPWEGRSQILEPLKEGLNDACNAVKSITPGGIMVSRNDVKCDLYTKENRENYRKIPISNPEKLATEDSLCFVIHGWNVNDHSKSPHYIELKNVLLEKGNCSSVCILDWFKPATQFYTISANNTEYVGRYVGDAIEDLIANHGMNLENFKIFGHSLGAQVSGFAGKRVQELTGEKLPVIVGMDPAGPCFKGQPESKRLNKDDARIVIVIHTNAGTLGIDIPCGTIDYFPNCGRKQPGCVEDRCHHQRSVKLTTAAIDKEGHEFEATQCESCDEYNACKCDGNKKSNMGDLETNETGNFYLNTTGTYPYAKEEDCSNKN